MDVVGASIPRRLFSVGARFARLRLIRFYHAPWSRSSGILWLLEEIGEPYKIVLVDVRAKQGVPEAYRKIQPSKKVPAIEDGNTVVTERAAIILYLADRFAHAGLVPPADKPAERAAYYRMIVYCDAVLDPAVTAHSLGLSYDGRKYPFGTYEEALAFIEAHLVRNPYAAGGRFSAADIQLASAINHMMNFLNALPRKRIFLDYIARVERRRAYCRMQEKDLAMAAKLPYFVGAA